MNVLVVHPTPRPFIDLDIDLLRSAYESFGMALAEVMLCDCLVATERGALPEVAGPTG